ncbi:MAG: class I SAM-dependent methyltransferase [Chloroflexota bacterium]|nr:MAG: class I SAM-dependent methyltransferase [Chloroflexota bacterium]
MSQEPKTWHYGLMARYWAEFNTGGPEIEYFQRQIENFGEPALDVACGAGRLLIPFLRAGLDVDGCDLSADMLAYCREAAAREGFSPRLYQQANHELHLPRTYRTICVCGGFGIGGSRKQDLAALGRFNQYLQPGGALVLNHHLPYESPSEWRYWLRENRRQLTDTWPPPGDRERTSDGDELSSQYRIVDVDPLEQLITRQIRVELWRDGQRVAQEEYTLLERMYFKNELLLMLAMAGFDDIFVAGNHTKYEATAEDDILVFIARK